MNLEEFFARCLGTDRTEINVLVDTEFLEQLHRKTSLHTQAELMKAALTLLDWAASEVKDGRVILSSDDNGGNVHRLKMSELKTLEKE